MTQARLCALVVAAGKTQTVAIIRYISTLENLDEETIAALYVAAAHCGSVELLDRIRIVFPDYMYAENTGEMAIAIGKSNSMEMPNVTDYFASNVKESVKRNAIE